MNRMVGEDPRWGVFLLHRIGHHEWVPEGMGSKTQLLDPAWEGTWRREKETTDWTSPIKSVGRRAVIKRDGDHFQISVAADREEEPFLNVEDCVLRYGGGSTYLPDVGPAGQKATSTIFGYRYAVSAAAAGAFIQDGEIDEAVAPPDPRKGAADPLRGPFSIRHYHRVQ